MSVTWYNLIVTERGCSFKEIKESQTIFVNPFQDISDIFCGKVNVHRTQNQLKLICINCSSTIAVEEIENFLKSCRENEKVNEWFINMRIPWDTSTVNTHYYPIKLYQNWVVVQQHYHHEVNFLQKSEQLLNSKNNNTKKAFSIKRIFHVLLNIVSPFLPTTNF